MVLIGKSHRFALPVFLFALFSVSLAEAAPPVTTCKTVNGSPSWDYCISKPAGGSNTDVLYYFHGATQSATTWSQKRTTYYAQWESKRIDPPTVVAVSLGRIWVLAEKAGNPRGGLLDHFMQQMLPRIEKELGGVKGRRILMGESMGGFNVSQLVLKYPSYWDRAALLCPAILSVSPFASQTEISDYTRRTRASSLYVMGAVSMFQTYFSNDAAWKSSSPLDIGPGAFAGVMPKLLIACGSNDEFGFFEGAEKFADLAKSGLGDSEWHATNGKHCSYPLKEVARFVTE